MELSLCRRQNANNDDSLYDKLLTISFAYPFLFDVLSYLFSEDVQLCGYRRYLFSLKVQEFFRLFSQHCIPQLSKLEFIWMEDV